MAKFAITAANGQLGSRIIKVLIDQVGRENVVGLARSPSKAAWLDVEIRPGDYEAGEQLKSSLAGIDAVMLLSGMDAPEKRIPQHRNIIQAALDAGCRKIVYTSIQGAESETGFSPVVQSNRQTESDIRDSGLEWSIGRNGIYIEPDIDYIETYKQLGEIVNCAGEGKCGYTTRDELAYAYTKMLTQDSSNGQTLNLHGE
ncbi:MAG: NAD(P)H-binding protein, partial [Planctomycetota bacterium]